MTYPFEVRERFLELVCSGMSFQAAELLVGVAFGTGMRWWRQCGLVELRIVQGVRGGLPGQSAPASPGEGTERRALTSEDRAVIAAGLAQRPPLIHAEIGRLIGRHRAVIGKEVRRNSGPDGSYHGAVAHRAAHERRKRPKEFKLIANPALCRRIAEWMDAGWSPGLIAAVLRRDHGGVSPEARKSRVSHETIYKALYVQTRGQLRADLHRQLSLKRKARRPRTAPRGVDPYREAFTIRQRPPEVEDRAVPGHWEGDLIIGAGSRSAVGTLVERSTRFTILLHLPDRHDADAVAQAMIREMSLLPEHLRRSITWDRGRELAAYRKIQTDLDTKVYFCDPHSPWQRGTNENTNRLLRHWLAKGTDLSIHTATDLRRITDLLNQRPRPTLGLETPAQRLNSLLNQAA